MKAGLSVLVVALFLATARGVETAPDARSRGFSLRQYQVFLPDLAYGSRSRDKRDLRAPQIPSRKADSKSLRVFLVESDRVVRDYLALQGVELPSGSLACHDPISGTFVVRTTDEGHEDMQSFVARCLRNSGDPCIVGWLLEILEAPESAVRKMAADAGTKRDHHEAYLALLRESLLVTCLRGETRSGVPAATSSGANHPLSPQDGNARGAAPLLGRAYGTRLELEAVIGADGTQVDVNCVLEHQSGAPTSIGDPEKRCVEGCVHQVRPTARVKSDLIVVAPCTRLLGLWPLDGGGNQTGERRMQAAFLRIAITRVTTPPNHRVMEIVAAHGEAVAPSPKSPPLPANSIPEGMVSGGFRVPPDFELSSSEEPPKDPFSEYLERTTPLAPGAQMAKPPAVKHKTAKAILEAVGIPFPEGSWARMNYATNRLTVVNTPANLAAVQAFFDEMCGPSPPRNLNFLFHIVEAEGGLIRRVQRETLESSEHAAAWNEIEAAIKEGKAKLVRTAWLEAKSGALARASQALEFDTTEFRTDESRIEPVPPPAAAGDKAVAIPAKPLEPGRNLAGLDVEIEPILGPDGRTLDLMIAARFCPDGPDEMALAGLQGNALHGALRHWLEHHGTKVQLGTAMLAGSTRLISAWKPASRAGAGDDVLQAAFLRAEIVNMERDRP